MWLISGPFDGEESGEVGFQKTKLLKANKKYVLGRKERQLVVNHKKVSHDHAEFLVGNYSQEDVDNPLSIPKLEVLNTKNKAMKLSRGSETLVVNPSATQELRDGDILEIVVGIPLSVRWLRVCCYIQVGRGKLLFSPDACVQLGINIVHTLDPHITHHLTQTFLVGPPIAHSLLLATQFVKSDWLGEIIRLGTLPMENELSNGTPLEQSFVLPPVTKFRPSFTPSLPPHLKVFKIWEPNEERLNMFIGYRFLFLGMKGKEVDPELREIIVRGGGEYEGFNVEGGRLKLHQLLAKGKRRVTEMAERGKGLVIVAEEKAIITGVGRDVWTGLVDEAQSFQLRFISAETIVQSVINVDVSNFAPAANAGEAVHGSSSLPEFVPNTLPDEPSISPDELPSSDIVGPSRRLRRTVTSRGHSVDLLGESARVSAEPQAPPHRALTRRAKAGRPVIIGIDDPSAIIDAEPDVSNVLPLAAGNVKNISALTDFTAPAPPSSRLKRRAGTTVLSASSQPFSIGDIAEDEPPLKKFKALFEASDPDRIAGDRFQSYEGTDGSSQNLTQTQTQTIAGTCDGNPQELGEEESQEFGSLSDKRRKKRKADVLSDDPDIQMQVVQTISKPNAKKRAVENLDTSTPIAATSLKPGSKAKGAKTISGATTGKPDTDEAFLQALASTKKGKKTEDSFDREFNQLKISKPDLNQEEQQAMWSLLEDFEDERNVRGNFMVIMEMDVYRKDKGSRAARESSSKLGWQLRANFKKFKKSVAASRPSIELVVTEENDYGMGSTYWKGNNTHSQNDTFLPNSTPATRHRSQTDHALGDVPTAVVDDSDMEVEQTVLVKGSRNKSPAWGGSTKTRRAKARQNSQPLFLDSEEETKIQEDDFNDRPGPVNEELLTLRSSRGVRTQAPATYKGKTKKAIAPIIVDDDSDDGATFKGFQRKKRGQ